MHYNTSSSQYRLQYRDIIVGLQILCVSFSGIILLPILTGLDSNVALFTAGVGTLIFQWITRGKVPIFLASSFAYVAPISYGLIHWGLPATLGGLVGASFFYLLLAWMISWRGPILIHRLFPPIVIGPVLIVIGLDLAPIAVNMATGKSGDGELVLYDKNIALLMSSAALLTTVFITLLAKKTLRLFSIIIGIAAGYFVAMCLDVIDYTLLYETPWLSKPKFVMPEWHWQAVLYTVPVVIASTIEHVGDILAIRAVTKRDYVKRPGLHKTLAGDGIASIAAACVGGPPNTTYSEVTGAVILSRTFNPAIMTWTAILAIMLGFVAKVGILLGTIPKPVMGGIMMLLFGAIASVGFHTLSKTRENLLQPRNIVIVALTIIAGIGDLEIEVGLLKLEGIGLAGILGILLNLILPSGKKQSLVK